MERGASLHLTSLRPGEGHRVCEILHHSHPPLPLFLPSSAQLINAGLYEDGYEAIDFALKNVPFRESPFIAKNIILITDEGRYVIPEGENLTRSSIQTALEENNILLNVVVMADYQLTKEPDRIVLGVDASGVSYVLEPNGQFSTRTAEDDGVEITKVWIQQPHPAASVYRIVAV